MISLLMTIDANRGNLLQALRDRGEHSPNESKGIILCYMTILDGAVLQALRRCTYPFSGAIGLDTLQLSTLHLI